MLSLTAALPCLHIPPLIVRGQRKVVEAGPDQETERSEHQDQGVVPAHEKCVGDHTPEAIPEIVKLGVVDLLQGTTRPKLVQELEEGLIREIKADLFPKISYPEGLIQLSVDLILGLETLVADPVTAFLLVLHLTKLLGRNIREGILLRDTSITKEIGDPIHIAERRTSLAPVLEVIH